MPNADKPLTPMQKLFVKWFTTPGETFMNGTRSCERAGYSGPENRWAAQASENRRKPNIAKAIRKSMKEMFSVADLTADRVLGDIEAARQLALADGDYSNALKASEMQGKYLKMFIDRIESVHTIEDVSNDELVDLMKSLKGKVHGLDNVITTRGNASVTGDDDGAKGVTKTH